MSAPSTADPPYFIFQSIKPLHLTEIFTLVNNLYSAVFHTSEVSDLAASASSRIEDQVVNMRPSLPYRMNPAYLKVVVFR